MSAFGLEGGENAPVDHVPVKRRVTGQPETADDSSSGVERYYASASELAKEFNIASGALEKRLERWRRKNPSSSDWHEDTEATSRATHYYYSKVAVRPIIDAMLTKNRTGQ